MTLNRAVTALLTVPALTLAACGGGGSSDKDQITNIIKDGGKDPQTICDHLTPALIKGFKGKDGCRKQAKATESNKDPNVAVKSVTVKGSSASATVSGKNGNQTISFVKQDGNWNIAGAK